MKCLCCGCSSVAAFDADTSRWHINNHRKLWRIIYISIIICNLTCLFFVLVNMLLLFTSLSVWEFSPSFAVLFLSPSFSSSISSKFLTRACPLCPSSRLSSISQLIYIDNILSSILIKTTCTLLLYLSHTFEWQGTHVPNVNWQLLIYQWDCLWYCSCNHHLPNLEYPQSRLLSINHHRRNQRHYFYVHSVLTYIIHGRSIII